MEEVKTTLYNGKVEVKFLGPTEDKPNRHIYMVNGARPPSVTGIIGIVDKSRFLIPWAVDLTIAHIRVNVKQDWSFGDPEYIALLEEAKLAHKVKKQEAATIGTEVHEWIEAYVKGEKVKMPERREAMIGVNAFLDWEKANKVKFISSERLIYSKKYGYVGTMDIEAKVNGELCLIDIKTSNSIYNTYYMQTAAYVRADEEETRGKKYAGRWIIRLAKETEDDFHSRLALKDKKGEYQVFEAKFLDNEKGNMKRDFDAFINCMELQAWDKVTNPYNGK